MVVPPQKVVRTLNPELVSRTLCGSRGFAGGIKEGPSWVLRWTLCPASHVLTREDKKAQRGHMMAEVEVPGCDHEPRDAGPLANVLLALTTWVGDVWGQQSPGGGRGVR